MPYLKKHAPEHIPSHEHIESLMSVDRDDSYDEIRPLQQLTEQERSRTNLVKPGKRTERQEGDPYGTWHHWAGNLNHVEDEGMVSSRAGSSIFNDSQPQS